MSYKIKASPLWASVAVSGLLLASVSYFFADRKVSLMIEANEQMTREIRTLRAKAIELNEFGAEALKDARERADIFRATLLSEGDRNDFLLANQKLWSVKEVSVSPSHEYSKVEYEFVLVSQPISAWPKIADAIRTIQASRGVAIRGIKLATNGDEQLRSFERVSVSVVVFAKNP